MIKIQRSDIQIITRHSNWTEKNIDKILKEEIYSNKESWQKFLRLFFISLSIGFTTAGIILFFAYNWADLHKFIKIGLIEGLIVSISIIILYSKLNLSVKNILLTGSSILVGVLFAVFGQVYQTGANAYDFFFGWTISILLWVAISNFAPLWLLFITLINTTILLYAEQVAYYWSEAFIFSLLFLINVLCLTLFLFGKKFSTKLKPPIWFTNIISLASVWFGTWAIIICIFDQNQIYFRVLIIFATIVYVGGGIYGLKTKNSFYLSIIPFSIIVIVSALLIKSSHDAVMFFIVSLFAIGSVTLVIINLVYLQKKWRN